MTHPQTPGNIINMEASQSVLREHFLGWQCRIRQYAVRNSGGRPTSGMRPSVILPDDDNSPLDITVLLIKNRPEEITAQFRHMVRKTFDPADRHDSALRFLSAAYYQRPKDFSDRMTALFSANSDVVALLLKHHYCRLDFEQYKQAYRIPCRCRRLAPKTAAYQATYWHNSLFNPNIPGDIIIIEFEPDWAHAEAQPSVT